MLPNELPEVIHPLKLCQEGSKGATLAGAINVSQMANLSNDIDDSFEQKVDIKFSFAIDENGLSCVSGYVQGTLGLICQRCLSTYDYSFCQKVSVSPVVSMDAAKMLPEDYEPLLVGEEGEVRLCEWVAEELNLALPLTPRHSFSCKAEQVEDLNAAKEYKEVQSKEERRFPFKDLLDLVDKN